MDKCLFSPGQMRLRHTFYLNGTVLVSNELGAKLVIEGLELPFSHGIELKDYGNGTIAYRLHFRCLGITYEVWEIFDFGARLSGVKITISGAMPTPGRIAIPLRAGAGSLAQYDNLSKIFWCAGSGNGSDGVGFDWKDMESIATFSPSTNTITANVSGQFLIDPTTIGTSTSSYATSDPFQRKTFYANGRYWVFYSTGTNMVFRTSTDGISFTSATTVRACTSGRLFSIWFDGTYVYYAYATGTSNAALTYRRGTPNSDGSITWSAVEQTAEGAVSGVTYHYPMISVDSQGYAWIGYRRIDGTGTYPYITKSGNNDGTWGSTPSGFPYQLSTTSASVMTEIIPLTSQKMLAIYAVSGNTIKAQHWDGSSTWGAEVATTSSIHLDWAFSAVAQGDAVHLAFLKSTSYDIVYTRYTYNSWGTETTVQASTTSSSGPTLSMDTLTNDLYCFWAGSPTANHIYYCYYDSYRDTWTSYIDWISETALVGNRQLTSFYQTSYDTVGLAYLIGSFSPYGVQFAYLNKRVSEYPYGPLFALFLGFFFYLLVMHKYPNSNLIKDGRRDIWKNQDYQCYGVRASIFKSPQCPLGFIIHTMHLSSHDMIMKRNAILFVAYKMKVPSIL